jgi:quinol-cytochrome oxidoreductase complex cytochrome b subunit
MSTQTGDRSQGRPTDWRARWTTPPRRHVHDTETRPFFVTSEFLVFVIFLMGLGITASESPSIDARYFWAAATVVTSFYMLSRGLAKSGTRSRAHDPREDLDIGGGDKD